METARHGLRSGACEFEACCPGLAEDKIVLTSSESDGLVCAS